MPIERRPKRARSWKIITSAAEAGKSNGENLYKRRKLSSSSSSQEVALQTQHDSVDKTTIISNNIRVENKIDDLMEQVMKMRREESSSSEKYESVQNSIRTECDNLRTVFSMMMMEMQENLDRKLDHVSEELRQSKKETETLRTEIEKLRTKSKKDTASPASPASLESDDSVKQNEIKITKDNSISRSDSKNAVTNESNQIVHTDTEVLPSHNNDDDELIFKSHNNNNKKKMSVLMRRITKKKRDKVTSAMAAVSLKRPVQKSKRLLSSSISSLLETRDGKARNYMLSLKRRKKIIPRDKMLRRASTKKKKIEENVKLQAAPTASWVDNGKDRKADQVSETSKAYYSWGDNCRKRNNEVEAEKKLLNNESDSSPKLLTSSWNRLTSSGISSWNQIKLMSSSSYNGNVKTSSVLPRLNSLDKSL